MSCKNAMLSHGLVNRADIGLVRTVAAVVRRSTWPEGICVCVLLFSSGVMSFTVSAFTWIFCAF